MVDEGNLVGPHTYYISNVIFCKRSLSAHQVSHCGERVTRMREEENDTNRRTDKCMIYRQTDNEDIYRYTDREDICRHTGSEDIYRQCG